MVSRIREIPKPVVAAVNGTAAGAGANIAFCCDIVVAAASASFIQSFSSIGLIPDSGGTFFLPRMIGFQKAAALMMLADKVSASDALAMGMLYKVYADDQFTVSSFELAKILSERPTKGIALTKKLLNAAMTNDFKDQITMEGKLQVEAADSYDYREGVKAFLEKRKPNFKGE